MPLALHNIKTKEKKKERTRRGRGDSSGYGNYSGRGMKGQKARSGVSGLKRIGMKSRLISQTPKLRGFKSDKPKNKPLNLNEINNNFKEGEIISPEILVEKKLIKKIGIPVKILGDGELQLKKLKVKGIAVSSGARGQIEKMNGSVE